MIRSTLRLDTALLERRLWLQQLAEQRGCKTLDEARQIEREDTRYRRLWYAIFGVGLALTLGLLTACPAMEDFTDTGVGCLDDCFEPMEDTN